MKNILDIYGLKCDNPYCNYVNKDVKVEDYPKWLNKPCPKCGQNLLTQKDFDAVVCLMSAVDMTESLMNTDDLKDDGTKASVKITLDGNGTINFGINPIELLANEKRDNDE